MMRVLAANPAMLGAYLAFSGALTGAGSAASGTNKSRSRSPKPMAATTAWRRTRSRQRCRTFGSRHSPQRAPERCRSAHRRRARSCSRRWSQTRGAYLRKTISRQRGRALTDADIVEVIASVALNIFTNYLNLAADTDIDFPPAASCATGRLNRYCTRCGSGHAPGPSTGRCRIMANNSNRRLHPRRATGTGRTRLGQGLRATPGRRLSRHGDARTGRFHR